MRSRFHWHGPALRSRDFYGKFAKDQERREKERLRMERQLAAEEIRKRSRAGYGPNGGFECST